MSAVNILLVEDNEINQKVASTLLRKWGHTVEIASDGQQALEAVRTKTFQMILMDLQMPVMDGYESTYQIRAINDLYFKTVPIIAYSASTMIDTKEKALAFGMTDFINKPLKCEEFQDKVNKYVVSSTQDEAVDFPLAIDFDLHTEGDPAFKSELIRLLSENISELQQSLSRTLHEHHTGAFQKTCHKVSTTLQILNNKDLNDVVQDLKDEMKPANNTPAKEKVTLFNSLCDYITKALQSEGSRLGLSNSH